jgi:hypothetical protein
MVPRQSDWLTAKSAYHDPKPEKQAKRVLLNKWQRQPANAVQIPDESITTKFHETFAEPLSSSKRAAMWELYPKAGAMRGWVLDVSGKASLPTLKT